MRNKIRESNRIKDFRQIRNFSKNWHSKDEEDWEILEELRQPQQNRKQKISDVRLSNPNWRR